MRSMAGKCAPETVSWVDAPTPPPYPFGFSVWGHSSAGRALQWHCRGRRFDPDWLHQDPAVPASPSSRGLGHDPFTVATGVRIPVGTPLKTIAYGSPGRAVLPCV